MSDGTFSAKWISKIFDLMQKMFMFLSEVKQKKYLYGLLILPYFQPWGGGVETPHPPNLISELPPGPNYLARLVLESSHIILGVYKYVKIVIRWIR